MTGGNEIDSSGWGEDATSAAIQDTAGREKQAGARDSTATSTARDTPAPRSVSRMYLRRDASCTSGPQAAWTTVFVASVVAGDANRMQGKFHAGRVQDEALRAKRTVASFPAADEDYFHDMDGGSRSRVTR